MSIIYIKMQTSSASASTSASTSDNKYETQKLYVKLLPFSIYDNPTRQYSRKIKLKRTYSQSQTNTLNVNSEFIIVSSYSSSTLTSDREEPIKTRKKMKLMAMTQSDSEVSEILKDSKQNTTFYANLTIGHSINDEEPQTNIIIFKASEHEKMKNTKYSLAELRSLCCHYGIKKSGTKTDLTQRIYTHLRNSFYIVKIQRFFRKYISMKYYQLSGPGYLHTNECVNDTDFYTFDTLSQIRPTELFTYRDSDNKVYGFHIASIFHLIITSYPNITNPYNRKIIPAGIINNLYEKLIYGSLLGFRVSVKLNDEEKTSTDVSSANTNGLSREKQEELFIVDLFQHINTLGNYADSEWFIALQRVELIRFIRNIYDIWYYRANLTQEIKERICPPAGNPFVINNAHVNLNVLTLLSDADIRTICVSIIDHMARRGVTREDQCLGAFYILATLTIVSQDARNALPWLYEAVI